MADKKIEHIPGAFRFFQTSGENLGKVTAALEGAPFFMSRIQDAGISLLAPEDRFTACKEYVTDSHAEQYSVLRVVTEFGPTSRGILAQSAALLADMGLQVLSYSGAAGVYFAVPEQDIEKAVKALELLKGPIPGSGEWKVR